MTTILVLGGFGFIGSNVLNHIDNYFPNNFNVIVFSRTPEHKCGIKFKCVKKVYYGDFKDITCLEPIFQENKIDVVLHLISSTVPVTSSNFRFDIESNLIASIEFVDLMIRYKTKNIIYLSSGGAIYGNSTDIKKESGTNNPQNSYGIVKLAIEKYLMLYSNQGKIKPLIIRLSNPYGCYHYSMKQGVLNVALRSSFTSKKFSVWGNGENSKDYIYVEDFVNILFKLINLEIYDEIINIGSGNLTSVNQILLNIKNIYPKFTWDYQESMSFDTANFELELSKLKRIIGDYTFTSLEEGIRKTNSWIRESKTYDTN